MLPPLPRAPEAPPEKSLGEPRPVDLPSPGSAPTDHPAALLPIPPSFLGSASLPSVPPERQPGEPLMLWHRWHPGGLPPQPAHGAALRPHQLRPRGHPCGQVSVAVTGPSPQLARCFLLPLSSREGWRECLFPLICCSGRPDPKETPSHRRAVPTSVKGPCVGGMTCPESHQTDL